MRRLNHTSKTIAITVGRKLREIRLRKQMSQRDVHRLSGLSQHQVSIIEQGQQTATIETVVAMSRACGTCPSHVFGAIVEALRDVPHEVSVEAAE